MYICTIYNGVIMERKQPLWFWILLALAWAWPMAVLLTTFEWGYARPGIRFLWKSAWVLYAGVQQSVILLCCLRRSRKGHVAPWVLGLFIILWIASFFLWPFGVCPWDRWYDGTLHPSLSWHYSEWFLATLFMHFVPTGAVFGVYFGDAGGPAPVSGASMPRRIPDPTPKGSGLYGQRTWLDDVWSGKGISGEFYGNHGEFDSNDEARRISEDMQQFRRAHPGSTLSDHYYWDDILDADTDGYLED